MRNVAVEQRLQRASVQLILHHPFFATVLMRLIRVEDTGAPTMWTDGRHLGYNPTFVESLSLKELVAVLAHETCHVAGLHHLRKGSREHFKWNVAADAAINALLDDADLTLPNGCVPGIPDKSAEEIYALLPDMPDMPNRGGPGGAGGAGCGEVREATNPDGSPLSEAERTQAEQDTKVMVQQAYNAAKAAGKVPAGLKRFIEEAMDPRVPWSDILARFLDGQSNRDYAWTRPNRRYASQGIIMPSLWSPGYGLVMFGCDTSGSIDQGQLKEICSEVLGCLNVYAERGEDPELTIAWFDHAVYVQKVRDAEELKPMGGGGTSFRVVMEWLAESGEQPKALIMVTDGWCSDFGEAPPCPVLWVLTHRNRDFTPPFGEIACVLNN